MYGFTLRVQPRCAVSAMTFNYEGGFNMIITVPNTFEPKPVHFSLRAPIVEMHETVKNLYAAAHRIGFCDISPHVRFSGDECVVIENDPHAALKVHARGFFVQDESVISFLPFEISGFSVALKNGNVFNIGLARFFAKVKYDGRSFNTRFSFAAQWNSFVRTVSMGKRDRIDCLESHLKSLMLLREAEKLGILMKITDPYKQWDHPDLSRFEMICGKEKQSACIH